MPWFTYIVTPIATGLRPSEAENAITVHPYLPQRSASYRACSSPHHPRVPVLKLLPLDTVGSERPCAAKPDHEVFDATRAIHLPVPQRLDMLDCWEADHDRQTQS